MSSILEPPEPGRLTTGVDGLDEILRGGFLPRRAYLVRGGPGTGKTTLGLHYLQAGQACGEQGLLITMGEPSIQIQEDAARIGLDLGATSMLDLSPTADYFSEAKTYDIFTPAEVEREPTTALITERVDAIKPQRVFLDAMTQFRYLSQDAFQFRRQVMSFLRFLVEREATIVFTSEGTLAEPDDDLQFISDGVINLTLTPKGRELAVSKFRGSSFLRGAHSLALTDHGMRLYPRLLPHAKREAFRIEMMPSGVPELDALLHGGLERGTVVLISGPSGTGKTTLGLQFMKEAAGRGERSVVFTFEEEPSMMLARCEQIGIPARTMVEQGTLALEKMEPLEFTPDEFARRVRAEVEAHHTRVMMIDSVAAYRLSLHGEDLTSHLHSVCKYLQNMGVVVLLVVEVETVGQFRIAEGGLSYLADTVIFLRYLELRQQGTVEMRRAIGVLKKRLSDFEKTLREIKITRYGLQVLPAMKGLTSILKDMPVFDQSASED